MRPARLALIFIFAIAALLLAGSQALADGPSGVSLKPLPPPEAAPGQESIVLAAQLTNDGAPLAGVPVTFYVVTTVFGERLMKVGESLSDATGTASVLYTPHWEGDQTVVARFAGGGDYPATQESFHIDVTEAESGFEAPQFGLEPIRRWLPVAVGLAILAVWSSLGFALATTVRGIPAAGAHAPVKQPLQPWDARVRKPAPLGRALLGMAVLLAVAAIPAAWLIGNARSPDLVSLSTDDGHSGHSGSPEGGDATGGHAVLPEGDVAATLISSVTTTSFDGVGQPAPGSVAMPADLAVTAGRVRILDATKGRLVTVTPEGKLASIFQAGQYGDLSLAGSPAMASLGENMYVALADGRIAVVNSTGVIEGVIVPVVPPGQEPLSPGGISVTETGGIWLSDAANHRVLRLNTTGEYELVIGEGAASESAEGLNTPAGVATDASGNLYVADTGNGVVKKFSPMGVHLQTIGQGILGQPTSVAIAEDGTVFVTDKTAQVVATFGPDGWYHGALGAEQLQGPGSVKVDSGLVYVIDPLAGLFVYQPEPAYASAQ